MSYFRLFKELKVFDLIKNGFARVALAKAGRKSKKSINFKKINYASDRSKRPDA